MRFIQSEIKIKMKTTLVAYLMALFFSGTTPLVDLKYNIHDDHIYLASLGDISDVGSKTLISGFLF